MEEYKFVKKENGSITKTALIEHLKAGVNEEVSRIRGDLLRRQR